MEYLKITWTVAGFHAPAFIWVVAVGLVAATVGVGIRLVQRTRSFRNLFDRATGYISEKFDTANFQFDREKKGLSNEDVRDLTQHFNSLNSVPMKDAWIDYSAQLVVRESVEHGKTYWSAEGAEKAFSENNLLAGRFNRDFFKSFPGVLTGLGLLFTFLAILVALLDVRLVDNRVEGLSLLIQGLSGKFITSIVALTCATLYLLLEKHCFHRLEEAHVKLASALDLAIPQISQVQLLLDLALASQSLRREVGSAFTALTKEVGGLQENVSDQTLCIQNFNTSLAPMLQQTFDQSMTPTLNRMVASVEGLNEFLRASEAGRNEAMEQSVQQLLTGLQSSINKAFGDMGGSFTETLSGSTQQQFQAISTSLSNTTSLLDNMNQQFANSQRELNELIQSARSTADEQVSVTRSQIGNIAETMNGLMRGLSERVDELGRQMSEAVTTNSEQAVGAAEKVIQRASQWSTQNEESLSELLNAHRQQLDSVVHTREMLEETITNFTGSLNDLRSISQGSQRSVDSINAAVASLAAASSGAVETHARLKDISNVTREQLASLNSSHEQQQAVWQTILTNLERYKSMFVDVEKASEALLDQIGERLENYQQVCEKGFTQIVERSDNHFTTATQKLGASVDELNDVLADLSESLGSLAEVKNNGHAR